MSTSQTFKTSVCLFTGRSLDQVLYQILHIRGTSYTICTYIVSWYHFHHTHFIIDTSTMHVSNVVALINLMSLTVALPSPLITTSLSMGSYASCSLTCDVNDLLEQFREALHESCASDFCSLFVQATLTAPFSAFALTTPTQPTPVERNISTKFTSSSMADSTSSVILTVTSLATPFSTKATERYTFAPYPAWLSTTYDARCISNACLCLISDAPRALVAKVRSSEISEIGSFIVWLSLPDLWQDIF